MEFDLASPAWTVQSATSVAARAEVAAAALDGHVYAIGGIRPFCISGFGAVTDHDVASRTYVARSPKAPTSAHLLATSEYGEVASESP